MAVHLNSDAEFAALVEQGNQRQQPVFIKFGATWCGPCKAIAPKFEQLAQRHAGRGLFCSVDIDALDDVANAFKVTSVPAFFVVRNQQVIDHWAGADPAKLDRAVAKHTPALPSS